MLKKCLVSAPSNIALVKYMGKEDSSLNVPANSSLSMTLNSLQTWVEITSSSDSTVRGARTLAESKTPLRGNPPENLENLPRAGLSGSSEGPPQGGQPESLEWLPELPGIPSQTSDTGALPASVPQLSEAGVNRILKHVRRVRAAVPQIFDAYGLVPELGTRLQIKTANTFPAASGIASSASSFAAVTLATALISSKDLEAFQAVWKDPKKGPLFRRQWAQISRQGSGSSCRSFEGPWVLWEGTQAQAVESSLPEMTDLVVLVSSESKEVSSSQAHAQVQTSPLWQGRVERAQQRILELKAALQAGDIPKISQLAWAEMWEMHSLFHTSSTPFTYWQPDTIAVLNALRKKVENSNSPPIVTLDAGPNIHIIIESSRAAEWQDFLRQQFPHLKVLQDHQGRGATLCHTSLGKAAERVV